MHIKSAMFTENHSLFFGYPKHRFFSHITVLVKLIYVCYLYYMAVHIVIDGYNLIGTSTFSNKSTIDLEDTREELIQKLIIYKRLKSCKITVVFDGKGSGNLNRNKMNNKGIEVIFSRDGEEADQILKEMAKTERQGMILVSSDRAVISVAESYGAVAIPSDEFQDLLSMAIYADMKGVTEESDEPSNKKGNPKKLPKKERQRLKKINKL